MNSILKYAGTALVGAAIAFPIGYVAAGQAEPEKVVEVEEVLPAVCVGVLDQVGDHLQLMTDALKVASDYPLIISELAPAIVASDNDRLEGLVDRMKTNEGELLELTVRQKSLDLGDSLEECAKFKS